MANIEQGNELSLNSVNSVSRAPELPSRKLDGELQLLQKDIQTRFPNLSPVLERNPWGYQLLDRLRLMPKDLESSLRVGEIARRIVTSHDEIHPDKALSQKQTDGVVLGALLSDIGRADDDPEKMHEVYSTGVYWRDDPNAWQWPYVQAHTGRSSALVLATERDPNSSEVLIPLYHHGLKKLHPYTAEGAAPIEELDPEIQFGIQVAAAADVADAVTRDANGEGRAYLKDEEFVGRDWVTVVMDEIAVDREIAELAVHHTLRIKGLLPDHDLSLSA